MKSLRKNIFIPKEKKLFSGMDYFFNLIMGKIENEKNKSSKLLEEAQLIYKKSLDLQNLDEREIKEKVFFYKSRFKLNKESDSDLLEALALSVEICFRITQKRAYDVQIMGALSLCKKYTIEMSTGEGKTLTAAIAVAVLGWKGKPLHIFTSNDYLAARDAELFEEFYKQVGLRCCSIVSTTKQEERKTLYEYDVVYTTAKEVLADFLKDRMKEDQSFNFNKYLIDKIEKGVSRDDYVLRGLEIAIVDEADSVLADDAVTPLIISAPAENKILQESVIDAYKIASYLKKDIDYTMSEKFHDITLKSSGEEIIEKYTNTLTDIWRIKERREHLIKQALIARELYILNKHYIIKEGKVVIVDEKTGRTMKGRSWGNGLHQAIEVKEGVDITDPTTTFAKMSFQRFFRLYTHLSGMSGTLQNLNNEFWQIYRSTIMKIPTRVPSNMLICDDKLFLNKEKKEEALLDYIKELHIKGIPVLIGLTTIKESEKLSKKLKDIGLNSRVLNALHDDEEALIIAKAGVKNSITIATNMAGRGTDITIDHEVNELGGLHVITTQRDKSRRIDLQFFGRCARQGQNGKAISFLALDDPILKNYINTKLYNYLEKNFEYKITQKVIHLLYLFYQLKIERDISKLRNRTLQKEFSFDQSISYKKILY